ncbi:transcription factor bHLH128-like isoform X2 [Syzygium oleosum]|uniref:transcription factor bHLH128-like isoform X2 n=1 Tax=Syzygium oleosum TaxID=219896 RepID=UPI0011D1EA25|nr:transcription factor bHLH128-like isoform X2 [Syzygium oleosum]
MYHPSSSSSSSHSQKSMGSSGGGGGGGGGGLTRYSSAPGSLLANAVDSVIGNPNSGRGDFSALGSSSSSSVQPPRHHHHPHPHPHPPPPPSFLGHYFSADSSSLTSESTCKVNSSNGDHQQPPKDNKTTGLHDLGVGVGSSSASPRPSSSSLLRQRSSPAGFLSHLTPDTGFSLTQGAGSSNGGHGFSRLKPQLSFTRQESLSHISEVSENGVEGVSPDNGHHGATHSYATTSFGIDWENSNSIVFSPPSGKHAKNVDGDMYSFNPLETQFSLPQTTLEMATVEKLLHIPEDSVPCKIRAKRGCATHPRSIAERERRTRISGRLKKLQELVPNMDKQTSYSDMLDLAVQHIKTLQNQVQKLRQDLENCTCGCKPGS